ncbi:hypothetical protein [Saccharopolyspora sp. NPDC002376]
MAHFSTIRNFDAHKPGRNRRGEPACGKPAAMTRARPSDGRVVPLFKAVEAAHGIVWVGWSEEGHPDAAEKEEIPE